jgi:phosphoglucomutase
VGKTFNKSRQGRDYYEDEFIYEKIDNKKRKKQNAELRKMRMRQFDDDNYGYESNSKTYRYR